MKRNLLYKFLQVTVEAWGMWHIKKINGMDNVPKKDRFIVVANHESYIDPIIIKGIFDVHFDKVVLYLTKKEAYSNPLKKIFFDTVGTIPVDRQKGKEALDETIKKINEGEIIGIFPEGTRSRDGKLHKGKTGAVRIALAAKCLILPIGINNTYELWPPHQRLPKRKKEVVINIGNPISLERYYNKQITKELLREITDKIVMAKIAKLSNQEYKQDE